MNSSNPQVIIERLTRYSESDAAELGKLMSFLSDRFNGDPIKQELLEAIINSPLHDQLVARVDGHIVGAATVSIGMGVAAGMLGHLEDFVTDPGVRRQGVGSAVWQAVITWCEERGVNLYFTSRPHRTAAHDFYLAYGAVIKNTTVFYVDTATEKIRQNHA
jgi:GNAT superfamily N-acetyltransferase